MSLEQDFLAWWVEYPRKEAKGYARKAYLKARKKVDAETLLRTVKLYRARREKEDPQYTKLPATWLNGECWEDSLCARNDALFGGSYGSQREREAAERAKRQRALDDAQTLREIAKYEAEHGPLPRPEVGAQVVHKPAVESSGVP